MIKVWCLTKSSHTYSYYMAPSVGRIELKKHFGREYKSMICKRLVYTDMRYYVSKTVEVNHVTLVKRIIHSFDPVSIQNMPN